MALPKKGTRKLLVNGRNYLWMIRRIGNFWDGYDHRITVQREDTGELFQKTYTHKVSITPADVKEFILERFSQV